MCSNPRSCDAISINDRTSHRVLSKPGILEDLSLSFGASMEAVELYSNKERHELNLYARTPLATTRWEVGDRVPS